MGRTDTMKLSITIIVVCLGLQEFTVYSRETGRKLQEDSGEWEKEEDEQQVDSSEEDFPASRSSQTPRRRMQEMDVPDLQQRAIFDLLLGILRTFQISALGDVRRARLKMKPENEELSQRTPLTTTSGADD